MRRETLPRRAGSVALLAQRRLQAGLEIAQFIRHSRTAAQPAHNNWFFGQ